MNIDHHSALQKSRKSISGDPFDLNIFRRASKLASNPDLMNLKSIRLPYKYKNTLQRFPRKSQTILPSINLTSFKTTQKCNTVLTFLISLIVISVSTYECEKLFNNSYILDTEDRYIRISLIGLTGIQIILIILYYKYTLKVKISYKILSKHSNLYQDKELLLRVMIEIFICILLLPPNVVFKETFSQIDVVQVLSTDEMILGFILIRSLHLYKLYYEFSPYNSIKSRFYCNILHIEDEFGFTLRCFLKDLPYISILLMFTLCTLLLGILLHIYEHSVASSPFIYIWNAFWIIAYTEPTVGYGDIVPKTHLGRFVCILSAFSGVFLYSYVVTIVKDTSELTENETKLAFSLNHKKNIENKLKNSALILIQRWWVLYMKRRVKTSTLTDVSRFNSQLHSFAYKHSKEVQEMNPALSEEIKKMLSLNLIKQLNRYLEPAAKSEENSLKLANMHHNSTKRLKHHTRRLRKLFGIKYAQNIDVPIQASPHRSRVSVQDNPAALKKLKHEAVKKLINKRLARLSLTHTKSLSSDEDFYSNSSRVPSRK